MRKHELKIHPGPFHDILENEKRFEVRRDDQGIEAGDILRLREWTATDGYLSGWCEVRVTYIERGRLSFGKKYCTMSVILLTANRHFSTQVEHSNQIHEKIRTKMIKNSDTVTIEVPLNWAEERVKSMDRLQDPLVTNACKAALNERKSLYARWQEARRLLWFYKGDELHGDGYHKTLVYEPALDDRRLIAAAPEMLDALISTLPFWPAGASLGGKIRSTIRAALPEDVAAEVIDTARKGRR